MSQMYHSSAPSPPLTPRQPATGEGSSSHIQQPLPGSPQKKKLDRFQEFDMRGRVYAVTGGGRGIGLAMAEAIVEAGGQVHCLDRLETPDPEFVVVQKRAKPEFGGSLHYAQIDMRNVPAVEAAMARITSSTGRLDGLVAAAGVNHIDTAIGHSPQDIDYVLSINYTGVFTAATAAAKQMLAAKTRGNMILVGSMSGLVANKGMRSPVYNSSKAAVIQLTRNLAMEWGRVDSEGRGGIRVNCLCPGHVLTPMVEQTFKEEPEARELWEKENMLGRLARPEEFRGAALFLLSDASSFMTGAHLLIDGGHTAW